MSVYVISTHDNGPLIGVLTYNEGPSTWNGRPIPELKDEELTLLWFSIDKYLDTSILEEIYVEMSLRGIPRIGLDAPRPTDLVQRSCRYCFQTSVRTKAGMCGHCGRF